MARHIDKRRRQEPSPWTDATYAADKEDPPHEFDDLLGETPIYAIQDSVTTGLLRARSELDHASVENSRKRGYYNFLDLFSILQLIDDCLSLQPSG